MEIYQAVISVVNLVLLALVATGVLPHRPKPPGTSHSVCSKCGHTVARYYIAADNSVICANCDPRAFYKGK